MAKNYTQRVSAAAVAQVKKCRTTTLTSVVAWHTGEGGLEAVTVVAVHRHGAVAETA